EAKDRQAWTRGMQGLAIRIARGVNRALHRPAPADLRGRVVTARAGPSVVGGLVRWLGRRTANGRTANDQRRRARLPNRICCNLAAIARLASPWTHSKRKNSRAPTRSEKRDFVEPWLKQPWFKRPWLKQRHQACPAVELKCGHGRRRAQHFYG